MVNVPRYYRTVRPSVDVMGTKEKSCRGWEGGEFKGIVRCARCWYVKSVENDRARKQGTWLRGRGSLVLRSCDLASSSSFWSTGYCTTPPTRTRNRGGWGTGIVGNRSNPQLLPVTCYLLPGCRVLDAVLGPGKHMRTAFLCVC